MHFGAPHLFWLFLLVPVIGAGLVWSLRRRRRLLRAFAAEPLVERLTVSARREIPSIRAALYFIAFTLLVFCLTRPQYGKVNRPVRQRPVDVIIAIDTSASMLAQDFKPNRLERAKRALEALLNRLQGERVGIITFAGQAWLQCPLTSDYSMAYSMLSIIDPQFVPVPGTAIGDAIRMAIRAFGEKTNHHKVLVLLTDGEDHETKPVEAAREAAKRGVIIYTIGIGTPSGRPVPDIDIYGTVRGFKKDSSGKPVLSRLNPEVLRSIAQITGGRSFLAASSGDPEIDEIYREIHRLPERRRTGRGTGPGGERVLSIYEDQYQVFLLPVLVLLLAEMLLFDRRRRPHTAPSALPTYVSRNRIG